MQIFFFFTNHATISLHHEFSFKWLYHFLQKKKNSTKHEKDKRNKNTIRLCVISLPQETVARLNAYLLKSLKKQNKMPWSVRWMYMLNFSPSISLVNGRLNWWFCLHKLAFDGWEKKNNIECSVRFHFHIICSSFHLVLRALFYHFNNTLTFNKPYHFICFGK